MTADRGPNTVRLTWIVLGLLAVCWLVLATSFGLSAFAQRPAVPSLAAIGWFLVFWLFSSAPYLLLGYAMWRGGRDFEAATTVRPVPISGFFSRSSRSLQSFSPQMGASSVSPASSGSPPGRWPSGR